jgi:ABC-2 type transport system ATP-binding protein
MSLLEFDEIKKSYAKREILSGVSFDIKEGEIFGLVGGSGSGKSTLLNVMIGIAKAESGKILFEGKDALHKIKHLRKNTGFATQANMLFDELTIRENSLYFGSLYGLSRRKIKSRLNELLKLLKLRGFENVLVRNLSGGMAKRANLLISLIHNPKLLILDEPTVGLDPLLRKILWNYIQDINKAGTTILVTSHLLDEIEENCSRVAVLKNGSIIAVGTPDQYREHGGKDKSLGDVVQEFLKDETV